MRAPFLLPAAALAVAAGLILASPARAAGCEEMFRDTGAPAYKGDPPDHVSLCRKGYVLSHNNETKVPDWVLEVLTPDRVKGSADRGELGNPFAPDPTLAAKRLPHATLKDYRGSGCDRGHMAPAADMKWNDDAMIESFFLSNMAPQEGPQFNRGIWADLEDATRRWIGPRGRLIVISGPIYDGSGRDAELAASTAAKNNCQEDYIGEGVKVPNKFYKIVYAPDRQRVVAFVLPNTRLKGVDLADYRASVREIEDLTGLNFFAALPVREQRKMEASKKPMWQH